MNIKYSDHTLNPKSILHGLFYLYYQTILLLLHLGSCIRPGGCVWFPVDSSIRLDEILVSSFSLVTPWCRLIPSIKPAWARATHGDHIWSRFRWTAYATQLINFAQHNRHIVPTHDIKMFLRSIPFFAKTSQPNIPIAVTGLGLNTVA